MMLSRVAERIYWSARYLQRVESAARMVNAYTNLLMDLPKEIDITWFNLVTLNNAEAEYESRYKVKDERNVVKFTLVDDTNSASMLTSLSYVRENFRTTRDVVPENAWEMINELSSFAHESIKNGALNRAKRDEFLTQVINQCQMIQGYVASTMSHDAVWNMWCLGRAIERADMSTRLLEAGAIILLDENLLEQAQAPTIIWGNVLRSASASHAYRRVVSARVRSKAVPSFLLFDTEFPRSVNYCVDEMKCTIKKLPKQRKVLQSFVEIDKMIACQLSAEQAELGKPFLSYINQLQLQLAALHSSFSEAWFAVD